MEAHGSPPNTPVATERNMVDLVRSEQTNSLRSSTKAKANVTGSDALVPSSFWLLLVMSGATI